MSPSGSRPGQHVGLIGANGVGKSTLLKILAGLLRADEGDAAIGGRVAYMPQDVGVDGESRTVRQLLLALAPRGLRDAGERVARPRGAARGRRSRGRDGAGNRDRRLGRRSGATSSRAGGTRPAGGSSARR